MLSDGSDQAGAPGDVAAVGQRGGDCHADLSRAPAAHPPPQAATHRDAQRVVPLVARQRVGAPAGDAAAARDGDKTAAAVALQAFPCAPFTRRLRTKAEATAPPARTIGFGALQ